jgi:chromosome segregation ATPase
MQAIKSMIVFSGIAGVSFYSWQLRSERHARAAQAMQEQEIRLASLQVELARQHANREAYVTKEKSRLDDMEQKLAQAKGLLAKLMDQWTDAREQVVANGRLPDPNEELKGEGERVTTMRRQLEALQQRLASIDSERAKQLSGIEKQQRATEAEYAWQLDTLRQEIETWQVRQVEFAEARGVSAADRKVVEQQLAELGMSEASLQEQQYLLTQSQAALVRQVTSSFAAQKADLTEQKERLQAQIAASLSHAEDLKVEIAVHNKRVNADKAIARLLQDKVKTQEDLVAQLTSDLATVTQRIQGAGAASK